MADYRKKLQNYLSDKMNSVAPSLASLIGDVVGARLISHAGSLTKLAKVNNEVAYISQLEPIKISLVTFFCSTQPQLSKFWVLRRLSSVL